MFSLKGALFLTQRECDIGFPAFSKTNDNVIYTCSLDRHLKIIRFYPIFSLDGFFFLELTDKNSTFSPNDYFPYMMFRQSGQISSYNLSDIRELEKVIRDQKTNPFISLQISRYLSSVNQKYQKDVTAAVTSVTGMFDLDENSRISYISSEISLASKGTNNLFGHELESASQATIDEVLKSFSGISEYDAERFLRDNTDFYTVYWACLFIYYESKWGMNEFLYIIGKEYMGRLLLGQSVSPSLSAKIVREVIRSYSTRLIVLNETDRDIIEIAEDMLDDSILFDLCCISPDIFESVFNIAHRDKEKFQKVLSLVDFLEHNYENLGYSSHLIIVEMVKTMLSDLTFAEIRSLIDWMERSTDFDLQIKDTKTIPTNELAESLGKALDLYFLGTELY